VDILCPYCNADADQILITALDKEACWCDEYGVYYKKVLNATPEEMDLAIYSRNYCFKCCVCGSLLQHSYVNHHYIHERERNQGKAA
jgi:hypothetical protein